MKRTVIIIGLSILSLLTAASQNVKEVTVASEVPYEEPVELSCDEKGLVLNVRMNFDEDNDILSLSLVPSRPVIFYRQDVVYKNIFPSGKILKTEKLPYPVQVPPASKIKIQNKVCKTYSKKRKNHLYNRWLGNVSSGILELAPEITEAGETVPLITTDSLFLRFKISPSVSRASFKIRNIQTIDLIKKKKNGKTNYSIGGEVDLNMTFNITLQRNPCCGMSAVKDAVSKQISNVSKAYHNLLEACPDGVALSEEESAIFNEHRKYLLAQFPVLEMDTRCQDVMAARDTYNSYVDSIRNAPCQIIPKIEIVDELTEGVFRVSSDLLVRSARKINSMSVSLLTADDPVEKRDIHYQGKLMIDEVIERIETNGVSGDDKEQALKLFYDAVEFWYRIISKISL